jgi:LPXTG-motif cell wall-anchored protein
MPFGMRRVSSVLGGAVGLMLVMSVAASAQEQTTSNQTKRFEVISVTGNDLVVRLPEGTRELTVPESFRFTVDGQPLSVHDLKPGMKGTATITTTTTSHPVTVTEVKNGTVMQASGGSILVRTDQGFKSFTQGDIDKRGVKIIRNGAVAGISDFHSGDVLTATIVTSKPPRIVTEKQVQATLARAEPAAAPARPTGASASAVEHTAAPSPADPAAAHRKLPKTASDLPALALLGLASLASALALGAARRRYLVR